MLRDLNPVADERLMVDATTGDDAAIWRMDDERALVLTADFITPIVDDATQWGRIAAANAVSDVYAMGGRPLVALNLVGWNRDELPLKLLAEVLAGAGEIAAEAGFVIAGGHTVDDPEPKFGLAVVGEAHPDRLLTNAGFLPGQDLILTKPLGIGVVATAMKRGALAGPEFAALSESAVESMTKLNDVAAKVALEAGATGATDITGFGLLGHMARAARESRVDVSIHIPNVPVLAGVAELARAGFVPGGSSRNLESVRSQLNVGSADETGVLLLADAQTSGGLLFGVAADKTNECLDQLTDSGHQAAVIGRTDEGAGQINLVE